MDDRAREIFTAAFDLLDRTADTVAERREPSDAPCPLERWDRMRRQSEEPPKAEQPVSAPDGSKVMSEEQCELLAEVAADLRREMTERMADLRRETTAQLDELRTTVGKQRKEDHDALAARIHRELDHHFAKVIGKLDYLSENISKLAADRKSPDLLALPRSRELN